LSDKGCVSGKKEDMLHGSYETGSFKHRNEMKWFCPVYVYV